MRASCRWFGAAAIIPTKTVPAGSARAGAYPAANASSAMRRDWPISTIRAVCSRCRKSMKTMKNRSCSRANRFLVQQKSGRALCHCFAGRFDSAAFCAFGGRGRRFGRRFYPLPAGGGGRRQRQPPAFRLSPADRSAAIRHRRQRSGVLAELRQCGGRAISLRRQQRVDQTGVC